MAVVEETVGPDQVEVVCERLLGPVRLLPDLFKQRRQVHRVFDDCRRVSRLDLHLAGAGTAVQLTIKVVWHVGFSNFLEKRSGVFLRGIGASVARLTDAHA